ncbi:MAG TPA: type VII secretion integral membrane protein EccD [Streptomyces sp.]
MAGLCRLRFHGPRKKFELSVPSDVPLADLMPTIIGYAGPDLDEEAVEHGGWVLQRLGEEPLDDDSTAESLGLDDGTELHLRHRRDALPPVHFDDLIDGVTTGMQERGDSWRPVVTHHFTLGLALLALAGGLVLLTLPGPHQPRMLAAVAVGALLLLGAGSASRAVADAGAGTALGAAAVPYLALAGALLPAGHTDLTAARLLAAGSAAAGAAVLALAAVACAAPLFLAVVAVAVLGVVAGVIALAGVPVGHAAALLAVVVVAFGALVPGLSFRLSGLRLPALPRNADELQDNIEPFPAEDVLARASVADGYLTAFHVAIGAVCLGCLTVLAWRPGWTAPAMTGALSVLLLLHARAVGSVPQRLAVLLPGVSGLALLVARFAAAQSPSGLLLLLAGLAACAALLAVAAWTVPGRRLVPYWGRAADLLHSLVALSLLPLGLGVTGVFHLVRGMNG